MSKRARETRLSADGYAFEEYCLSWQDDMVRIVSHMCRDAELAQDVVQNAWIKAWRNWPNFRPYEGKDPHVAARSWLIQISVNEFYNLYQSAKSERKRREKFAMLQGVELADAGSVRRSGGTVALGSVIKRSKTPAHHNDPREDFATISDEVEAALRKLDARSREMLERCDFRGEPYKEIAEAMKMPIGTVMSGLFRARKRLAVELAEFARREYRIERRDHGKVVKIVVDADKPLQAVGT